MGKLKIEICVGTACHIMGAHELIELLENFPGWIREKIDYKLSACFGMCHEKMNPPIVKVNDKYYENVTPTILKAVIMEALEGREKL